MKIFTSISIFVVLFIAENHAIVDNAERYDDFIYETEVLAKGACDRREFPLNWYDRKEKLELILEEFNTFMGQKALTGDSSFQFPGENLIRKINFEALDKKMKTMKMMDQKNKIHYYWKLMNENSVRKIVPGALTRYSCEVDKIFDWGAKVDPDFNSDVNTIYKEFAVTVGELMQDYENELKICNMIPAIHDALIDFVTQSMKAHFQRYVIDVFDARISTFCRSRCITTELRVINRRFIRNLDGLEELIAMMVADWHEFQEKCELKSTTTTSTTTTSTTTPAPIIIPPFHRTRPRPSDDDDNCLDKIFSWFKHDNYFD